ncbi:MAG: hypothetical protein AAGI88_13085 [Pseudomonadota bacterium]
MDFHAELLGQRRLLLALPLALIVMACSSEQADPESDREVDPKPRQETPSEASESVATGPDEPTNTPISWQDMERCPEADDSGGATKVIHVHCGTTPSYAFDDAQRLHVVFEQSDRVYYTFSDSLGERFSVPVEINKEPEALYSRGENRPKVALGPGGEIYVSWSKKTEGRFNGEIRFSRSLDAGKSFSKPATVNDDNLLTTHRFDQLTVDQEGNIFLSWIDKRDRVRVREAGGQYTGAAIYYTVSDDRGASFKKNQKLADHSCECCRIAALPRPQGKGVTLLWRHIFPGSIRDHAIADLSVSLPASPGGVVPTTGSIETSASTSGAPLVMRATTDEWKLDACPHHGPAMAAAGSDHLAHLVWFTNGSVRSGISYGQFDRESSSTRNVTPVDREASASHADIAAIGSHVYVVWKKESAAGTRIMLTSSSDDGATWQAPLEVHRTTEDSDYPFLLTAGSRVYLAWKTDDQLRLSEAAIAGESEPEPAASGVVAKDVVLTPFSRESLSDLEAALGTSRHVVMLWSVDCAPCFEDLALVGELQNEYGKLPVTLIATDGMEYANDIVELVRDFGLEGNDNWVAGIPLAQLRTAVDSQWYGELPRTYFYAQGQRYARSGTFTREQLISWLGLGESTPSAIDTTGD